MISWIQRTFQHHFRLIFAVLLIGMVIPFIFTIGSTPGIGRAEQVSANRDFFGHNLLSQEQYRTLMEDTRLSAELQYGATNVSQEQLQGYMYQRIASQHLADELHLPPPPQAEITDFIKRLHIFLGSDGQFDVTRYDAFRSSLKGSTVTEADIARVISDDARMDKVGRLLAGPGYVMPSDVKEVLAKGDTAWTISTATIDYASYAPDIRLTDAEVAKYLSDNSFRYTIAPRVVVDYVSFPTASFTAGIAPTEADIRDFYDSNPGRFPKPAAAAKAAPAKPDPAADYAAVEPQVREALVNELARRLAVKAASDLAFSLYDGKVTSAGVDAFLASRKLKADGLAPFTAEAGPAELGGSKEIAAAAFGLNSEKFYSEGLPSPNGAVVLIWKSALPSRQPALSEIHDKVRADAMENQKRIRFVQFGKSLKEAIQRRLKAGDTFEKAVAASAGSVKVDVKSYPAFTLRTEPKDVDRVVFQAMDGLDKGSVSDMEATPDKGVIVYAANKQAPAADDSSPRYVQLRTQLAGSFAAADETAATREIVDAELKRTDTSVK
jgi:peptidyl-prolyl cis-trans isomerase D